MDARDRKPGSDNVKGLPGISELDMAKNAAKHLDHGRLADILVNALGKDGLQKLYSEHPELTDYLIIAQGITKSLQSEEYFEDYRVLRKLRGGMGWVLIATYDADHARARAGDPQVILILEKRYGPKPVAIKVMPDVGGGVDRDRFGREMDASKDLDPELLANVDPRLGEIKGGVVPILDDGFDEQGNPYFVMPVLFPIPEERLPEREALNLGFHVAKIVSGIHDRGMIHRDLKPANVMLAQREAFQKPVVCDFGLVKRVLGPDSWASITDNITAYLKDAQSDNVFAESESFYDSAVTDSRISILDGSEALKTTLQTILGTPIYMSPEQARGDINETLAEIDRYKKQKERLLVSREERDKLQQMIDGEKDAYTRRKLRTDYFNRLRRIEERLVKYGGKGDRIKELNRKIDKCHEEACKLDQYAMAAMIYTWVTGKAPVYARSAKHIRTVNGPKAVREIMYSVQDPDTDLLLLPNEVGVSENLSAVILKAMEKDTGDRYRRTTTFVLELEACLKGKKPWVLTNNPTYLQERMLRKLRADKLLEEKRYREGRENLEEYIGELQGRSDRGGEAVVRKIVESWTSALSFYQQKLESKLSDLKSWLGDCSAGNFVKHSWELLELLSEVKVLPAERRAGDRFPSATNEEGRWKLHRGNDTACAFWIDILRTCGLDAGSRIDPLVNDQCFPGIRSGPRACLLFEERHPEAFLRDMTGIKELFEANNGNFVPQYDKDELDSRGQRLGGILLGVESMAAVDALFRADKCAGKNGFGRIARRQVDAVMKHLMREDGSVFRFGIFDQDGHLMRVVVDKLAYLIADGRGSNKGHDRFENGVNVSRYTSCRMQAYLIEGLVAAYRHTKEQKYKTAADKAIKFFVSALPDTLVSYHAVNMPEEDSAVENCAPTAIVASSLFDYSTATQNKKARKTAVKLLQALVKNALDTTGEYEGILRGYKSTPTSPEKSHVESDRAFVASLLKTSEQGSAAD